MAGEAVYPGPKFQVGPEGGPARTPSVLGGDLGADPDRAQAILRGVRNGLAPSDVAASFTIDRGQHLAAPARWPDHVARAVPKRRREFLLGRHCASEALCALEHPTTEVGAAGDRSPVWPAGTTGSISHSGGAAVALVGRSDRYVGIGVDVEQTGRLSRDLWAYVFDDVEAAWLNERDPQAQDLLATLTFSAKESYYKAHYAWRGERLAFHDVRIVLQDDRFLAADRRRAGVPAARGRHLSGLGLVVTAICIERPKGG